MSNKNSNHWANTIHPITAAAREACDTDDQSHYKILSLLWQYYQPQSVADFGCGLCRFLHQAKALGASSIHGFDIPEVDLSKRKLTPNEFTPVDLTKPIKDLPVFDLSISVEVAEHLPETYARTFVQSLTKSAPVVLFGASIPYQGGMGHVNENWLEYWFNLFKKENYVAFDIFRENLWVDGSVTYFYRQNTILYVADSFKNHFISQGLVPVSKLYTYVHPDMYIKAVHRSLPPEQRRLYPDIKYYYSIAHGNFIEADFEVWSSKALNYSQLPNARK